jgi:hypothetical protein
VEHNVAVSLTCQLENGVHTLICRQPQDPGRAEQVLTPLPPLGPGDPALAKRIRQRSRWRYGRRPNRSANVATPRVQAQGSNAHVTFFQVP